MPKSYSGCLLTASKDLRDPNFLRTVVLILEHGEQGRSAWCSTGWATGR